LTKGTQGRRRGRNSGSDETLEEADYCGVEADGWREGGSCRGTGAAAVMVMIIIGASLPANTTNLSPEQIAQDVPNYNRLIPVKRSLEAVLGLQSTNCFLHKVVTLLPAK
jgi:hypothetical protein